MTIGHSAFRIDAPGKVTGATLFPGDVQRDDFLHAKVVFTDQPHARLLHMNIEAAQAVPGVVAVFTAKDVPVNEYGLTMFDQPVFIGVEHTGRSTVPCDVSRWEADHLAIVVAESAEIAHQAAALIVTEWEPLPILDTIDAALNSDVLIHPENGRDSNVYYELKIRKGNMGAGWDAADIVVEGRYELPYQEHAYLQPEAAVSYIDEQGRVTVAIAAQWTHEDQEQIAHALDLPRDQVRVVYPAIGGAFGGREDMSLQIVMALASWRLHQRGENRPIRTQWSREESIVGHHKRHRAQVHTRWGASKDGKITAVEADVYLDAGAYNYTSNKVLGNFHITVSGAYEIPNAHINSRCVYTTATPGGAFRGFGAPQGAFTAENQMNKLAAALGMDPVAIRLKNCLREDSISITQTPMPAGVSLPQVIEACAQSAGWHDQPPVAHSQPSPFASLPPFPEAIRRGRGFACAYKNVGFSYGFPERNEATIELYGKAEIDRVVVRHAGADCGQGAHTVFRQMAATAVGVPLEKVEVIVSDTAETGDSGSASASRMTFMSGNAIREAAEKALAKWTDEDRPAIGHTRFTPRPTVALDYETGYGDGNITFGYVAQYVELAVDIETGHIVIERVVSTNDVGKALNPQQVEGQIEGAVVQALGYSVTEKLQTRDGRILNPRLSTYLIPGIRDIPQQVDSVILEIPDPQGPWGARGMAEMPFIPLAPAITAALHDATGVWFDRIPLTPERVVTELAGAV
ncbi:MAG: xanthine dehydrogenase family protein molybdopterin-binding subunit [Anaerolineae bacterium]|nr:xanthine dehydrogenase family protein molybdopterin-binding subunit [Anaerolineae bacterium]MCO5196988.1 xanthine dehydrogenase family protein molybdopterin-binding subunit [Anaerolineae bacterium]